ncbi:hypothetical protein BDBG_17039 [Blastomyces gilchristii SLH14081]|uniref:Uncharacterized protein n=1 Tax=Blastomyces gilchristii (strain SLH14081) TaxID=559298 RepID=A0A179UKV6_BLAGS|nr:uncharacterized protein BDBG_17039 [Blastomyces gilchristii SLH14081]OAT08433.1 hypothetical protein BDBG_17039 [Blastomyces gilchristii SLH14081]
MSGVGELKNERQRMFQSTEPLNPHDFFFVIIGGVNILKNEKQQCWGGTHPQQTTAQLAPGRQERETFITLFQQLMVSPLQPLSVNQINFISNMPSLTPVTCVPTTLSLVPGA